MKAASSKRVAALRDRRRNAGMVRLEVWAHPDDAKTIKAEAERLMKARKMAEPQPTDKE